MQVKKKITEVQVKEKITKLLAALNVGVYERENELKLALLSSIAGESIFLLGPPGVAKSLVARKLKFAYKDAKVFEYLMSRFSTPDEIFGPVSIQKLINDDKYERVIDKYLPSAEVVFLDEIWKAGSSIQNALLTVINEKIFRNGDAEIKVPMKALISASNELPAKDEGLEALWDRFLVRLVVNGIENKENFNKMISEKLNAYDDNIEANAKITEKEYTEWKDKIDGITVPDNVFNVIHYIRNYIATYNDGKDSEEQNYVSDRRWRKIVRLLRTSAFLNDRSEVDLMDCFLIEHCIWNEVSQKNSVHQFVVDAIGKYGYTVDFDFKGIKEEIEEFKKEVDTYTHEIKQIKHTMEKVYNIDNEPYLKILGLKGKFNYDENNLIKQKDITSASKDSFIQCKRYNTNKSDSDNICIKQGSTNHMLYLSNDRYSSGYELSIEIVDVTKKQVFTKVPHPKIKEDWDKRVEEFISHTNSMKEKIEKYRKKDLKHLRENLFVLPELANLVESHITETEKSIEKIEVDVRKIQHSYKTLVGEKGIEQEVIEADDIEGEDMEYDGGV